MAVEERWQRREPFLELDRGAIQDLLGVPVAEAEPLSGGLRNTNYRVRLVDDARSAVLRLYTAEPAACAREVALHNLVRERVPVPSVLSAEPGADPPWALLEFIDGDRMDQMLVEAAPDAVERAAHSAGEVLAAIHSFSFASSGFFGPNLEVAEPEASSIPAVDKFFASRRARELVGPELAAGVVRLVRAHWSRLEPHWPLARLQHADYKPWNLLIRDGQISGVLDWEFAFAGSPLNDIGIFLRYSARMPPEYEVGFLNGYRAAGGSVPDDVLRLARLTDLVTLTWFLDRPDVDPQVTLDLTPLIVDTLEAFSQ